MVSRAFTEAYKQASASSQYAKQAGSTGGSAANNLTSHGLTMDEACKILNVSPPREGKMDMQNMVSRFKRMFDQNNPEKGGSFYLQSKVLRARERIELEMRQVEETASKEQELREGWKPKMYRDR